MHHGMHNDKRMPLCKRAHRAADKNPGGEGVMRQQREVPAPPTSDVVKLPSPHPPPCMTR